MSTNNGFKVGQSKSQISREMLLSTKIQNIPNNINERSAQNKSFNYNKAREDSENFGNTNQKQNSFGNLNNKVMQNSNKKTPLVQNRSLLNRSGAGDSLSSSINPYQSTIQNQVKNGPVNIPSAMNNVNMLKKEILNVLSPKTKKELLNLNMTINKNDPNSNIFINNLNQTLNQHFLQNQSSINNTANNSTSTSKRNNMYQNSQSKSREKIIFNFDRKENPNLNNTTNTPGYHNQINNSKKISQQINNGNEIYEVDGDFYLNNQNSNDNFPSEKSETLPNNNYISNNRYINSNTTNSKSTLNSGKGNNNRQLILNNDMNVINGNKSLSTYSSPKYKQVNNIQTGINNYLTNNRESSSNLINNGNSKATPNTINRRINNSQVHNNSNNNSNILENLSILNNSQNDNSQIKNSPNNSFIHNKAGVKITTNNVNNQSQQQTSLNKYKKGTPTNQPQNNKITKKSVVSQYSNHSSVIMNPMTNNLTQNQQNISNINFSNLEHSLLNTSNILGDTNLSLIVANSQNFIPKNYEIENNVCDISINSQRSGNNLNIPDREEPIPPFTNSNIGQGFPTSINSNINIPVTYHVNTSQQIIVNSEQLSDELFFKDKRYTELQQKISRLENEVEIIREEDSQIKMAMEVMKSYIGIQENMLFDKEKSKCRKLHVEEEELMKVKNEKHVILKQNNELKLSILKMMHQLQVFEMEEAKRENDLSVRNFNFNFIYRNIFHKF
jgi:hypothetical protein